MREDDATVAFEPSLGRLILGLWVVGMLLVLGFTVTAFGGGSAPAGDDATGSTPAADTPEASNGPAIGEIAPDATFDANKTRYNLSDFADTRILLWFPVASCETCQLQARSLADNRTKLQNVTIIALTPHGESLSSGVFGAAFGSEYAPGTTSAANWIWGVPSETMMEAYNPALSHGQGYLIDERGYVLARGSKPADNVEAIARFGNESGAR